MSAETTGKDIVAGSVNEEWVYAGRRLNSKGQLLDAWLPPDGETLIYDADKARRTIGGVYIVTVKREGDGISLFKGSKAPKYAREGQTKPEMLHDWKIKSVSAETDFQHLRDEQKHKTESADLGAVTLSEFRALYRARMFGPGRAALIASLIEYVTR